MLLAAGAVLLVFAGREALDAAAHHGAAAFAYPWGCPDWSLSPGGFMVLLAGGPCDPLEKALGLGGAAAGLIGSAIALGRRSPRAAIARLLRRAVEEARARQPASLRALLSSPLLRFSLALLLPVLGYFELARLDPPWPYPAALAASAWLAIVVAGLPAAFLLEASTILAPAPPGPAGPAR